MPWKWILCSCPGYPSKTPLILGRTMIIAPGNLHVCVRWESMALDHKGRNCFTKYCQQTMEHTPGGWGQVNTEGTKLLTEFSRVSNCLCRALACKQHFSVTTNILKSKIGKRHRPIIKDWPKWCWISLSVWTTFIWSEKQLNTCRRMTNIDFGTTSFYNQNKFTNIY